MTSGIKIVIMAPDTDYNREVFHTITETLHLEVVDGIKYGPIVQVENVNVLFHWDGRKQKEEKKEVPSED